ncbi:MAG: lipoprotein signal peptidase [Gammaproteobacteria bacterium]|nr:lipoprotein signal peptidase [Gammaproteobacteria bacterium]
MLKWLWLSIAVIVIDQLTKLWIDSSMTLHERLPLIEGFFDLTLAYNPGAAFSFLADAGGWQRWFFTILSTVVTIILVVWLKRLPAYEKVNAVALALIIGGAVGNLIDRIAYGHVIDFLLVYYQQWSWPAFNVADSAISVGVVLMLLAMFHSSPSQPE